MKKRLLPGLFALFALSSLGLFAACGGDDDDTTDKTPTTASTSEPKGEGTAASGTGQATAGATTGGGEITGSGADELKKLSAEAGKKTFSANYDMDVVNTDKSVTKRKITVAYKSPKLYTQLETTDGPKDELGSFIIIDDGKNSFLCSGSGSGKACIKSKSDGTAEDFFSLNSLIGDVEEKTVVTKLKDETIAGVASKCFNIKDSTTEGVACFGKDNGIMTRADQTDGTGKTTIKATKISTNVDDKQFEPPKDYVVTDLGG
ncbi:MAG: hypothetical protein ACKVT1_17225 [Dehalococcoidia bacterium]